MITPLGGVTTIAGGFVGFLDGYGTASCFNGPFGVTGNSTGTMYIGDQYNNRIRALSCVICPAGYYCSSGIPVLCPVGSYCPLSSTNPMPCPPGTFSTSTGASSLSTCTPCAAGTYSTTPGANSSTACLPCAAAPGSYCPPGSTAPTATLTCPIGAYCVGGAALNVSCYSVSACTVTGLSAPPCNCSVSTLTRGSGAAGWDGQGTAAVLFAPAGVYVDPVALNVYVSFMHYPCVHKFMQTTDYSTNSL